MSGSPLEWLGSMAARVRRELDLYHRVAAHPGTPTLSRWLLVAAVAYAASPVDVIPDFIPVLGHLDDAIIIPALVIVALKQIPPEVIDECRLAAPSRDGGRKALPAGTGLPEEKP